MPIAKVAPKPPPTAHSGTTHGSPPEEAYTPVAAAPRPTPASPPRPESISDSATNWMRIWPRVAPSERRRPIS